MNQKAGSTAIDDCLYQYGWEPRPLRGQCASGACGFPAITEIAATAVAAAPELRDKHPIDVFHETFRPRLNAVALPALQNAFLELGWNPQISSRFTLDQFLHDLKINESFQRLVRSQLRTLSQHGILQSIGDD